MIKSDLAQISNNRYLSSFASRSDLARVFNGEHYTEGSGIIRIVLRSTSVIKYQYCGYQRREFLEVL